MAVVTITGSSQFRYFFSRRGGTTKEWLSKRGMRNCRQPVTKNRPRARSPGAVTNNRGRLVFWRTSRPLLSAKASFSKNEHKFADGSDRSRSTNGTALEFRGGKKLLLVTKNSAVVTS